MPRETLPWRAPWQPYAAWYGFVGSVIITLVAGFPVFLKGNWNAADFVASYVGIPIFVVPIVAWKVWHKTKVSFFFFFPGGSLLMLMLGFFFAVREGEEYRSLVREAAAGG